LIKNLLLAFSIVGNAVAVYVFLNPETLPGPRMTCEEARSDHLNKQATATFASDNDMSLSKVHAFLRASGYQLRNIDAGTYVYTTRDYRSACGISLPGIDGSILRVRTDVSADSAVLSVN
jgi:hypothetical protein